MMISRYRRKRNAMIEQMNRQQREELYEVKLRFLLILLMNSVLR